MKFQPEKYFSLYGYSYSDWDGSDDKKKTLGYFSTFGFGVFSWNSKKQEVIAQSTTEVEYVVAVAAANKAIWLKLMVNLYIEQKESTQVIIDNQAAISTSKNPMFHGKTKHFKIKLYLLREMQNKVTCSCCIAKLKINLLIF